MFLGSLLAAVLISIVFSPVIKNGFVNWDDDRLISENGIIRELTWDNIRAMFTSYYVSTYIPLTVLSFAIDYNFWKLDPRGYHLENVFWHILNCLLAWLLFMLLGIDWRAALLGALVWGVHPLRVESVAWAAERKDVLFAFFYLSSLSAYVIWIKTGKNIGIISSFLLFLLSCLAKGVAVTLPLTLFAVDYYLGRNFRNGWKVKMPFLAVSAMFAAIAILAQSTDQGLTSAFLHPWTNNLFIGIRNIAFYLYKIFWPFGLSAFYPYPVQNGPYLPFVYYLSPAALFLAAFIITKYFRKSKTIILGLLFYVITVLPLVQFMKLRGEAIASDRYTYLPAIGITFIIAVLLSNLITSIKNPSRKSLTISAVAIAVIPLSILSYNRTKVWESSQVLWDDVIAKYPQAAMAYNYRGLAYQDKSNFPKALDDFGRALELQPDFKLALGNRGLLYGKLKEYDLAIADFSQILRRDPADFSTWNNRGNAYLQTGKFIEALYDFSQSINANDRFFDAYFNRAFCFLAIYEAGGDKSYFGNALQDLDKAIEINQRSAKAYNLRGLIKGLKGDLKNSQDDLETAVKYDTAFGEAYNNLAILFYIKHDYSSAARNLEKAKIFGYFTDSIFERQVYKNQTN